MPDLPAYHDGNSKHHNYQYLWMAHWMGKSCNSVLQMCSQDGADDTDVAQASVTMNMGCESNSRSGWYPLPLSSYNQNIDSFSTLQDEYVNNSCASGHGTAILGTNITDLPSSLCILASKKLEFSSEDDFSLPERIKDGPVQCQESIERESLPSSRPFTYMLPGMTSSVVPYKHRPGGTPAGSFMLKDKVIRDRVASKNIFTDTKLTPFENDTYNSCSYLASWMSDDGVKYNHLNVKDPSSSFFRQKVGALQTDDPSSSKLNSPCCAGFLPSCNNPERVTELEDISPGSYLLQKMPICPLHDEETLKMCSIGDSVEYVPEFPPRISQTTHDLCFAKSFGVSLSKGDRIIRESKLSKEVNAKALYELFSLSSPGSGKQGPKLQSIGYTSSSEGKEKTCDGKKDRPCLQKELSADTDMLDNCVTRNFSHGVASFLSIKDLYVGKNLITAGATCGSSREVGSRKTLTVIPNICEDTPGIMTTRNLTGKRSTSRTVSLEDENLFSRVRLPMYVNPSEELYVPEAQPDRRLVKRLKLNTCDSLAQETGTPISEPASSGRKVDSLLTKVMRYNITSKDLVKNQNESDRSLVIFEKLDFSSMDSVKGHEELTLSHPWIQRWRHSQPKAQPMKPAPRVIREPEIPKPMSKKQRPSFAAMALMGKASNQFRPCEFRKRGSVTVWNTEGF